jgi:hypothetical protein
MSRTASYSGPFDETGLVEAASFQRQHSRNSKFPAVRLLVTDTGLVFGPAGHRGAPLTVPFNDLNSVRLIIGTRPRTLIVTPPIADRVGQVELETNERRIARFSGLPINGIQEALQERGASIAFED